MLSSAAVKERPSEEENALFDIFKVPLHLRKKNYLPHLEFIQKESGLGEESFRFF